MFILVCSKAQTQPLFTLPDGYEMELVHAPGEVGACLSRCHAACKLSA